VARGLLFTRHMRNAAIAAALVLGLACSTTTYGNAGAPGATELGWVKDRAFSDMHVVLAGGAGERTAVALDAASPTDIRFKTTGGEVIPLGQIRRITVVEHALGALEGAAVGAAAGGLLGFTLGLARPLSPYEMSMDCTIVCSKDDAAKLGVLMYGALGLLIGAATGAVIGHRSVLEVP
jgi:hypothetical protein